MRTPPMPSGSTGSSRSRWSRSTTSVTTPASPSAGWTRCGTRSGSPGRTSPPGGWCRTTCRNTTLPPSGARRQATIRPRAEARSMANLVTARGGEPVSIVHVTAEYYPYARTGGLAEAVAGLADFQHAAGLPVTAILPLYRTVRDEDPDLEPVGQPFVVTLGARHEEARIFRAAGPHLGPQVFFIEHLDYFNRPGIYGEGGADYADNHRRFAFFALAA